MTFLGIDLGDHGALAWLEGEGGLELADMPVVQTAARYELDIPELWTLLRSRKVAAITIELLHAMPPSMGGASANFKRGAYIYAVRAMCHAIGAPLVEVPPKKWQKYFGYSKGAAEGQRVDTKGWSYLKASRFFPGAEFKSGRGRVLDGRCDAALLALYGRQTWGRQLGKEISGDI